MTESYELFKRIHASRGMVYLNRRKIREFSTNIFRSNYAELKQACEVIERPDVGIKLFSDEHRHAGIEVHMEVMRLFHNFLAAAKSLVDHTRAFVDENYGKTSLSDAYADKVRTVLSEDLLVRFIQDLRNYMMHKGLPGGSMSLSVKRQSDDTFAIESTVSIKRDDIAGWNGWTKLSRTYLASASDEIKISDLARDYAQRIEAFSDWLDKAIRKHHAQDIRELRKLDRLYRSAEKREADLSR